MSPRGVDAHKCLVAALAVGRLCAREAYMVEASRVEQVGIVSAILIYVYRIRNKYNLFYFVILVHSRLTDRASDR